MAVNAQEVRRWFDIFHGDGDVTEVRLLGKSKSKQMSGYFKTADGLLAALVSQPEGYGIYSPINSIKTACYSRLQCEQIIPSDTTTSDNDIDGRRWILIDLDPKRPSGTNSTDSEKAVAYNTLKRIATFLRDQGFSNPVYADSANGYHIYYRVNLANTPDNTELIKNFLNVLDMFFGDDAVDIDTSVYNASRISKIIGTSSNKGTSTAERPRRMSAFIRIPDEIKATDIAFIKKVASMMPVVERPSRFNNYSESFDLDGFIRDHGIEVVRRQSFQGGEKLILRECPFDSNHKAPDAALFRLANGAIGFKCLHNSCAHYTWRDFRLHYDPQAYNKRDLGEYNQKRTYYSRSAGMIADLPAPATEVAEKGKKWLQMTDISYVDPSSLIHLPTGVMAMDKKIMGLALGDVTIISGIASSGKTSIIDFFILNNVQRGFRTAVWSGELQGFRFQGWLDQMAAGPNFVKPKEGYEGIYYAPRNVSEKIHKWLDEKLWLYNNEYGNKFSQLFSDIKNIVEEKDIKLVVLDNLMALQLDAYGGEKNDRQTQFINDVKDYAKKKNIHVIVVCHPRKEQSFQLLRMESIAGASDLFNLADNVFIIHRVGRDFQKRAKDFFGQAVIDEFSSYDSVIEICKNRDWGIKDFLIGLFYERSSRRFKNDIAEHIVYGWQDDEDDLPQAIDNSVHIQSSGWTQEFPIPAEVPSDNDWPTATPPPEDDDLPEDKQEKSTLDEDEDLPF